MAIALVQHTSATSGSVGLSDSTATLTGTTLGNLFTIGVACYAASTTITMTTDNGTTCNQATNAAAADGNDNVAIFYGVNAASGSVTFTAHYSAPSGGSFPTIQVQEWSGAAVSSVDVGVGNSRTDSGVTSVSILTNGVTTQTNQLIYSIQTPSSSNPTSAGTDQTLLETNISSYQLVDSSGATITHTYNYGGSNNVASAIAVFAVAASDTLMGAMVM